MSDIRVTQKWDELYLKGGFSWRKPHEILVQLLPDLQAEDFQHVLDLACGAGRHLRYLGQHGFQMTGIDISVAALQEAAQCLTDELSSVNLVLGDMISLPFDKQSYDLVLCLYSIYHGSLSQVKKTVDEIRRVLRPGGQTVCTFISTDHDRFGQGQEIAPNTFITLGGTDAGIPHHFSDENEIQMLFRDFKILRLDLIKRKNERGIKESHWLVVAVNDRAMSGL